MHCKCGEFVAIGRREAEPWIARSGHGMRLALRSNHPARRVVDDAEENAHEAHWHVDLLEHQLVVILVSDAWCSTTLAGIQVPGNGAGGPSLKIMASMKLCPSAVPAAGR